MSTQEIRSEKEQYTLWQIFGIWLAAGAPMCLLGWVAYPALSANLPPTDAGLMRIKLLTLGLIWEFVLAMIILYREEGNIRWGTIRRRFWLNHPVSPKTGKTKKALWWWIIPLILLTAALEISLRPALIDLWNSTLPFFAEPEGYDAAALFAPELQAQWVGAWGLLGLFVVFQLFNTFLGEEFIFHGVLLPKMEGVLANGIGLQTASSSACTIFINPGASWQTYQPIWCLRIPANASTATGFPSFCIPDRVYSSCF